MNRRQFLNFAGGATALALVPFGVSAAAPPVYQTNKIAINGYDPVAYFTAKKATEGKDAYAVEWNGATWRFASAENMKKFQAKPERYAPQFGGYCAYAVAQGSTATTDPDAWTITDDKLYLNFSKSVRALWTLRRNKYIKDANANWPAVLG